MVLLPGLLALPSTDPNANQEHGTVTCVSCATFKAHCGNPNEIRVTADQDRNLELRPSNPDGTPDSQKRQYYPAKQLDCLHDSPASQGDHPPVQPTPQVSINAAPEHGLAQLFHRPVAHIRSDVASRDSGRQSSRRQQSA